MHCKYHWKMRTHRFVGGGPHIYIYYIYIYYFIIGGVNTIVPLLVQVQEYIYWSPNNHCWISMVFMALAWEWPATPSQVSFRQSRVEYRRDSHYLSYPSETLYGFLGKWGFPARHGGTQKIWMFFFTENKDDISVIENGGLPWWCGGIPINGWFMMIGLAVKYRDSLGWCRQWGCMGVSSSSWGYPFIAGWCISWKIPISNMDNLEVPPFMETPTCTSYQEFLWPGDDTWSPFAGKI